MTERRAGGKAAGTRTRSTRNTSGRPRQGVASKELQEARRRKRQREVMRNRIIFGVVCVLILALLITLIVKLFGAIVGSGRSADTSTITFEKDGEVIFEEVTDFDTDTYSKSELKTYTKDLIANFNDSYGSNAVELDKIRFKANQVYIKTSYTDATAYSAFSSYETYSGNYEDAVTAGYDFAEVFSTVAGTTKADGQPVDAASSFAGDAVAIVKENCNVVVPGQILYVSTASTEIVDEHTVSIKQADGNDDATDLVYIIYSADK